MESAFERLEIVENGLGFDRDPPPWTLDEQVPRSEITRNRQRDLGSARETWVDVRPEPIHQPLLAGIAERISGRKSAQDEIEPTVAHQAPTS